MIVCSCNVLSDHDVRHAVCSATVDLPRSAKQVYDCLGRNVECGRCARTIKTIIDEALGECAKACHSGCRHSQAGTEPRITDSQADAEFFLEAAE
ncbi:(2Fe-2S)-binding protein [Bradyrhizobium sp.]|jgi:bacterioferritin-associated ferredoxin|uniref:(2Fe-2S)-binding protein n=1 Tax=Bradyrhizobium sp. TaxID=376 RepID=UPI003C24584E